MAYDGDENKADYNEVMNLKKIREDRIEQFKQRNNRTSKTTPDQESLRGMQVKPEQDRQKERSTLQRMFQKDDGEGV